MTEPDNRHADGGGEQPNDAEPSNDVEVDPDPDQALTNPTDEFDEETPDPDVAEVTDPADPSFVEPATPPEGTVLP